MNLHLLGRTAVVSGGTRGLGRLLVDALLVEGANVVSTYRSNDEAAAVFMSSLSPQHSARLRVLKADMSQQENCKSAVALAVKDFGRVDVVVNNAGTLDSRLLDCVRHDSLLEALESNLASAVFLTQAAMPIMVNQNSGRFLNISSAAPHTASPREVEYSCAKAGLEALTRTVARQGGPNGITANAIAPHVIEVGMGSRTLQSDPTIVSRIPIQRPGHSDEFVALALFLCSSTCNYLNGQVIHLNGGRIMAG